jgi:hypothetical protein
MIDLDMSDATVILILAFAYIIVDLIQRHIDKKGKD